MKKILVIAGSDSGGGAGIQADLKAISSQGVYSATAITSITAQNTMGVQSVEHLSSEIISEQIDSVVSDIKPDIIKIGMLGNKRIVNLIADKLEALDSGIKIVTDTVMVAKGGHLLLDQESVNQLINRIISLSYIITPNIPEAKVLSGLNVIENENDMINAADKIFGKVDNLGYILLKGGHLDKEELVDILMHRDKGVVQKLYSKKINTKNTHGTGCTYASLISARLARGNDISDAVTYSHKLLYELIKNAPKNIGSGHGPLWHFPTL
jgi:hydroxymethylpyrimidine kinase/phosphomethylpyrimidine kinase